jgi:hypothetical protein
LKSSTSFATIDNSTRFFLHQEESLCLANLAAKHPFLDHHPIVYCREGLKNVVAHQWTRLELPSFTYFVAFEHFCTFLTPIYLILIVGWLSFITYPLLQPIPCMLDTPIQWTMFGNQLEPVGYHASTISSK